MLSLKRMLLAGLAGVGLSVTALSAAISIDDPLPDLSAYSLQGALPDLAGKVVLLDFWASWCAPCKESFPAFTALQRELADRGFVILAVSVDQRPRDYERFLTRLAPGFATVLDAEQTLVAAFEQPAMPTSFLFGRDGRLRAVHAGFHGDRTIESLRAEILQLLSAPAP